MSKAVKVVVAVAAAVIVPYAAPIIAQSIGLSAAIGTVAGSAVVGAGLGAVAAAATGQKVGTGAIMGAIGGGLSGYMSTPTAPTAPTTPIPAGGPLSEFGQYSASLTAPVESAVSLAPTVENVAGLSGFNPSIVADSAGPVASWSGLAPDFSNAVGVNTGTGWSGTGTLASDFGTGTGVYAPSTAVAAAPTSMVPLSDFGTYSAGLTAPTATAPTATAMATAGTPKTFSETLAAMPKELAARFTDPKVLADMTLKAAGSLAGSYAAGDGMAPEERALLDAQTSELKQLQSQNQALFNQRIEQAQNLIGESKYFDPEYFGLQRARKAQIVGASAKRGGLRGLTGGKRTAEERRYDLATGRDTGTAYDQGYGTGVAGRLTTMQAGMSMMPTTAPDINSADYTNIYNQYGKAADRSATYANNIGGLFGSLYDTKAVG
jgi:hypothetical protein